MHVPMQVILRRWHSVTLYVQIELRQLINVASDITAFFTPSASESTRIGAAWESQKMLLESTCVLSLENLVFLFRIINSNRYFLATYVQKTRLDIRKFFEFERHPIITKNNRFRSSVTGYFHSLFLPHCFVTSFSCPLKNDCLEIWEDVGSRWEQPSMRFHHEIKSDV